jgi:hypothetical protein
VELIPTYAYRCARGHEWDVVKRIADIDAPERCAACDFLGERQVTLPSGTIGASDWNTQSYNPGLGCYTRSNKHGEQIAKSRGLEPIGNEKTATIHKTMDAKREERRADRWADADREKVYE